MTINTKVKWNAVLILCVFIVLSCVITDHVAASDGPVMSDKATGSDVGEGDNGDSGSGTLLPDLFTGAMRYSIPIEVVPGRKGMQPDLALTYRSNKGNGWVGVGWDLDVMAIERRLKGLTYDDNVDTYILRMAGAAIDLIYDNAAGYYRAKIENDFYKIQKISSGQVFYWLLIDKTGRKHLFGQTAASRQDDPKPDSNKIFKWCLDHVEDTNGNYMDYLYIKQVNGQPYQGQIYLDQIKYTGNTANGTGTTNYVKFYLEERSDAPDMYTTLFLVQTRYRLKTIDINAQGNHARTYSLVYDADQTTSGNQYSPATGRSLLTSVRQFDKNVTVDSNGAVTGGSSLPPVLLGYQFDTSSFTNAGIWHDNWCPGDATTVWVRPLDFNGDGKTDMACHSWFWNTTSVSLSNGTSAFTDLNSNMVNACAGGYRQIGTGHFNADGKEDFYCFWPSSGTANVTLSAGNGFGADSQWVSQWGTNWPEIGDFDGDGITDLVSWQPVSGLPNGKTYVALSNGADGFTVGNNGGLWLDNWCANSYGRMMRGDFNGDGKTDLFCHKLFYYSYPFPSVENKVALSNGVDGFTLGANGGLWLDNWCNTGAPDYSNINVGDFNGDGMTDLICSNPWTGKTKVALSNGVDRFTVGANDGLWRENWCFYSQLGLADFNNDGMTDIYCAPTTAGVGNVSVALSNGKDAFTNGPNGSHWIDNWCGYAGHYTFTGDFNGDGKTDLLCTSSNTGRSAYIALSGSSMIRNDLLSSVYNGLGGNTSISYKPSTTWVNTQLPFPVHALSSITTCDNYDNVTASCNGNTSKTTYEYSGGFYHIAERDFRGFNYVKVTGPAGPNNEQAVTETWFHQGNDTAVDVNNANVPDGYMKGKPYRKRVSDATNNAVYTETTISYAPQPSGATPPPYFNPPYQVDTFNCDGKLGTSCVGNTAAQHMQTVYTTYDQYGNVKSQYLSGDMNNSTDTSARTVAKNYLPNTTAWILSLPTNETIYNAVTGSQVASTDYYYDYSTSHVQPTKGNLTRTVRWLDGTHDPIMQMAYDDYGNITSTTSPNGKTATIDYDTVTNTFPTVSTTPPVGTNLVGYRTTTQYYGGAPGEAGLYGQVQSVTDANGAITSMTYDTFGRKKMTTAPDGTWTSWSYPITPGTGTSTNTFGAVGVQNIQTDTAVGISSWTYFDGLGRTIIEKKTGPAGKLITTKASYNKTGTVSQTTLPYFDGTEETPRWKNFTYDPLGRAKHTDNPDGTSVDRCYYNGVTVVIDADKHRKRETKNVQGKLVTVEEYLGTYTAGCTIDVGAPYATTTYAYDVLGNLLKVTDAEGNQTTMQYDSLGRKINMQDPDMGNWAYAYDANGNLIKQTDARGQIITFTYDSLNRVTKKHYPRLTFGPDIVYTYDVSPASYPTYTTYPIGRLTTMTDASGITTLFHDNMGRTRKTIRKIAGTDYPLDFGYTLGRLTSVTYKDGDVVNYRYDGGGNLDQATDPSTNKAYATYENFNALAQPGNVTYGNAVTTSYEYYPTNNRLMDITTLDPTSQKLLDLSYNYSDGGNVNAITDNIDSTRSQTFTYDDINRLIQAQSMTYGTQWYTYDQIGNITSKEGVSYTYTDLNGATIKPHAVKATTDGKTYTYDANGNMISNGVQSITYDYDNMPRSVILNGVATTFAYDGGGTRTKKVTPSGTTIYIDKFYECNGSACSKYIFAGSSRIAHKSGTSTYYYHQDHLGSTAVVTGPDGSKQESISYFPFGAAQSDTGVSMSHKYTSQEFDAETGLYYYGARYYNPVLGRFISPDAIVSNYRNPQAFNRYSYVLNNPLIYVDPTGHEYVDPDTGDIVVEQDDWLSTITSDMNQYYGTDYTYDQIADHNGIEDPDRIYPGDRLSWPNQVSAGGQGDVTDPDNSSNHVVKWFGLGFSTTIGEKVGEWGDGYVRQTTLGVAWDETGDWRSFKSLGKSDFSDNGNKVFGFSTGILGLTAGKLSGNFNDFFGESREQTYTLVVGSVSKIQTTSGAKGNEWSAGGKGIGYSGSNINTYTYPLFVQPSQSVVPTMRGDGY